MKEPRVRDIVNIYIKEHIKGVYEYLTQPNMIVDSSTWAGQIKIMIENKEFKTASTLIASLAYKLTPKKKKA